MGRHLSERDRRAPDPGHSEEAVIFYGIKRLLFMIPLLLLISAFTFVLVRVAPGGPFDKERKLPAEIERNINAKYHLDWPMWKQYVTYLGDLCHGDLGLSLKYRNRTV